MDDLVWSSDLKRYHAGEYSYAAIRTHTNAQCLSQIEIGKRSVFVGIYEGHGGDPSLASSFVNDHLFNAIIDDVKTQQFFSEASLKVGLEAVERDFIAKVRQNMRVKPEYMVSGASCLTGVIFRDKLYVANLGDCRAVIGSRHREELRADLVTDIHNLNNEEERAKFLADHAAEEEIVTYVQGSYKIKGKIEVTKSVGDAYLKSYDFKVPRNRGVISLYRIANPFERPYVGSEPFAKAIPLFPTDDFVIFGSSSLWDQLSNTEAVEIVSQTPNKRGAARNLINRAVEYVALRSGGDISYQELKVLNRAGRYEYHDDLSAIVLFLNHPLLERELPNRELRADRAHCFGRIATRFTDVSALM